LEKSLPAVLRKVIIERPLYTKISAIALTSLLVHL